MNGIFEFVDMGIVEREVMNATSYGDIESLFSRLFNAMLPADPDSYKTKGTDYGLKVSGKVAREKINAQCREILARITSPKELTDDDRAVLLQYSGRGGLTEGSQYEYYTPTPVAEGLWEAMKVNGFENGNVLDPCTGAGVMSGTKPSGVVISGNDLDETSSKVAALLNPEDKIVNAPFEQVVMDTPDDTFDGCITNVPFGDQRGAYKHIDQAYKHEKHIERYFILRILDKIRPGKLACLIVPTNIVGARTGKWKQFRQAVSRKAEFLGAHKLPSGAFAAQGTDTVVDIVVFRKHPADLLAKLQKDEIPTETLNASKVFWDEFIDGKYWMGDGKRFIQGKYIPRDAKERFSRERVEAEGPITSESMKRKLAVKFSSRINWEMLELEEPIDRAYSDGDQRYINGEPYEFRNGQWNKLETTLEQTAIDPATYGVNSVQELESILADPRTAMNMSIDAAFAALAAYPHLMSPQQKDAIKFAMSQPRGEVRTQVYRGSMIGAMLARMSSDEAQGEDVTERRKALQELVVAEIEKYGHPANNPKLSVSGPDARAFGVFVNCVNTKGDFSALLAGTLDKSRGGGYRDDDITDIVAYLSRIQEGVEFEDVKGLYKGAIEINSLGDIAEIDGIAITEDGMIETMASYCSGSVLPKMAAMAKAIEQTDDERLKTKFRKQIDEMSRRIPRSKIEDITFNMQAQWFPRKYLIEFLRDNGYSHATYGKMEDIETEGPDGKKEVVQSFVEDFDAKDGMFFIEGPAGKPKEFNKQIEGYLNGGKITSSKREIAEAYKAEADKLESMFDNFMKTHIDVDDLAEQYNLRFNSYVESEYPKAPLDIDEYISGEIVPHDYQAAEVRRLSDIGSGICGFGVGLGKSFTALAMSAYNHKHNKAKRTCVVVPSSVLENWYHEARMFYNESYFRSNVLFVGLEPKTNKEGVIERRALVDEQGQPRTNKSGQPLMQDVIRFTNSPEEIFEQMWRIPQSNCSLVVMTKEKFSSIPMRPESVDAYTDEMVRRHMMSAEAAQGEDEGKGRKKPKGYDLAKKIEGLRGRYSDTRTKKKRELPYLEDMGFDSIVTDESHFFKNSLGGGESTQGIAYIPNADPANIAVDMSLKSYYIRQKNGGRGVYGLTATPVTNSPIEIFNMLNLVADKYDFEERGIYTVDDFIRVFGKIELRTRAGVDGELKEQDTLVGFKNLSGLRNLFRKYVNIKTVEDVDDEIHVPDAVEKIDEVPMSDKQTEVYERLKQSVGEEKNGGLFSVMRDMDRCTTDLDLYYHRITYSIARDKKTRLEEVANAISGEHKIKTEDEEGKVVSSTINVKAHVIDEGGDSVSMSVPEELEGVVIAAMQRAGINLDDVNHPLSPKYAKLIENLKKHLDAGGKQLVFTEEKTQHAKIKRILVHNLPITDNQVAIINAEDASGDKLDKISKAYNAGDIKIVIANKKAEVGVNLQKGTTAIHHLTLPWTPASINQRNGRGVRQGNKVDSVDIFYYVGKGTFDEYRQQMLKGKANWINALLMGNEATAANADLEADEEMYAAMTGTLEEYRKKRAEEEARKAARSQAQLVNRLKQLASLMDALNSHDERLNNARETCNSEIEKGEQYLRKYRQAPERYGEEAIAKARAKIDKAKARLAALDEKFEAEKAKNESRRKQVVGLLRQADKNGELPFSAELIDHPERAILSSNGNLFAVGDTIEYKGGILLIKAIEKHYDGKLSVNVETISASEYSYVYGLNQNELDKAQKVSYSKSELAIKRLQSGNMDYAELAASGVTKQQFMENATSVTLRSPAFVKKIGTNEIRLITGDYQRKDNDEFVWPEPQDATFRKAAMQAWLSTQAHSYYGNDSSPDELMTALFGENFQEEAMGYANIATDEQLLELCSKVFDENFAQADREWAVASWYNVESKTMREFRSACNQANFHNDNDSIQQIGTIYLSGIKTQWQKEIEDAKREKEREAENSLRSNPNFREVPLEWQNRFKDLDVEICYNTQPYSNSFRGRNTSFAAFERLFIHDKAFGGPVYQNREKLKAHGASWAKTWDERSGGWWHLPATIDLEALYAILS